jgi:tryptophanase
MELPFEPFRIRVVEPIRPTTRRARGGDPRGRLQPLPAASEVVLIDLVTDSGVSALSIRQWSAMHGSDESFTGSRSFRRFEAAARELFGKRHVIPCHQGRAAEHLLCRAILEAGQLVLGNTLFATTRANIEEQGGQAIDLPIRERRPDEPPPFKGDIDLLASRQLESGAGGVAFVILTLTDNSGGGQPASLANIRAAAELCRRHRVPLLLDAARIAENCFLITRRESGQDGRSPREVARDIFSLADGVFMSMKKDALGNSGGVIALDDDGWAERIRIRLLVSEASRRRAAGRPRPRVQAEAPTRCSTRRTSPTASLRSAGSASSWPPACPSCSRSAATPCTSTAAPSARTSRTSAARLVVERGPLRGERSADWEVATCSAAARPSSGGWRWPALDLLRLAVPRRVYTSSHLDYVARSLIELYSKRLEIRGLRFVYRPPLLPQFIATFEPA